MGRPCKNQEPPDQSLPNPIAVSGETPREPETERGQLAREHYLAFAKGVLADDTLNYPTLYQQYGGASAGEGRSQHSDSQQAAKSLDQSVALLALKSGTSPRQVIQVLAQGPFTQHQIGQLSPEAKQTALPGLLHYAQSTVAAAQQQRFVEYANGVTGKVWSYPDLYREHIGSDLAAIQLDQKVAAAALNTGESGDAVAHLLQHSPYSRFQRDVKQVKPEVIEQYARGTVAQVQEIQSLRPVQAEKTQGRDRSIDR